MRSKKKIEASIESIEALKQKLEKDYGNGIVLPDDIDQNVTWVPTGIFSLDWALGGGMPRGRIIEVYGNESAGKTSLCMHCLAKYQKTGGNVALIDAEYAYEPKHAQSLGINDDKLMKIQPDCGEDALNALEDMVKSNLMDGIVVDSVAALVPKDEVEGDMGKSHMGLQARLMSQALRKLTSVVGKTKTTVFFINQIRHKIGIMYGNPETTSGGNALKFYASIRVEIKRAKFLSKTGEDSKIAPVGMRQMVKVVKNKCAPPFRETELKLWYNRGYDTIWDLFNLAVNFGIIEKGGAWFSYKDERLGQGESNSVKAIRSDKDILKSIAREVKKVINS